MPYSLADMHHHIKGTCYLPTQRQTPVMKATFLRNMTHIHKTAGYSHPRRCSAHIQCYSDPTSHRKNKMGTYE
jgi:hypothetical protein